MSQDQTPAIKLPLKADSSLRSRTIGRIQLSLGDKGGNSKQRPKSPKGHTWHKNVLDPPMSSVRSIPRPNLTWEPGMLTVDYILRNLTLPKVVQCDHTLCDHGKGTMGFDCGELIMMRSKTNILKVKAISLAVDPKDGKTLVETDDRLMVPVDYKGWFAVMGTEMSLQATPHYRSVGNLAQSDCHSFLIGGTENVKSAQKVGETFTDARPLCPGDVLKMGTLDEEEKHLHCTDENDRDILIPVNAVGTFYIMQHKTRQIKVPILQVKDVLQKYQFPCIVKLVYGREPTGEGVFTKILCLENAEQETFVLASTLLKSRNTLHELSNHVPNKFKVAIQSKELVQNPGYISALNLCQDKGDLFMRGIKIFKQGATGGAEPRVTAMGITFASPSNSQNSKLQKENDLLRTLSAPPALHAHPVKSETLPQGRVTTEQKISPLTPKKSPNKPPTSDREDPVKPLGIQSNSQVVGKEPMHPVLKSKPPGTDTVRQVQTSVITPQKTTNDVRIDKSTQKTPETVKPPLSKTRTDDKANSVNKTVNAQASKSPRETTPMPNESSPSQNKPSLNGASLSGQFVHPPKHISKTPVTPKSSTSKIYVTTMTVSAGTGNSAQSHNKVETQSSINDLGSTPSANRRQRNPDQYSSPPPPPPTVRDIEDTNLSDDVLHAETNNNLLKDRPPVKVIALKKPNESKTVRPAAYEEVWTATSGKDDSDELSSTTSSMSDTFIQSGIGGQIITGGVASPPRPKEPEKSEEDVETEKIDPKAKFKNLSAHYSTIDFVDGKPMAKEMRLQRSNSDYSTIEIDDDSSASDAAADSEETKRKKKVSFSDILDVQTYQKQHVTTIDIDEPETRRRGHEEIKTLHIPRPRIFGQEAQGSSGGDSPPPSYNQDNRTRRRNSGSEFSEYDDQGYMMPVLDRKGRVKLEDMNRMHEENPPKQDVGRRISHPNLTLSNQVDPRRERRRDSETNILW